MTAPHKAVDVCNGRYGALRIQCIGLKGREVVGSVRKYCGYNNVEVRGERGMSVCASFLKCRREKQTLE